MAGCTARSALAPDRPLRQTLPMIRIPTILTLCLLLAACGFHLRNALTLPSDLGAVRVAGTDRYSPLGQALMRGLEAGGVALAGDGTDVPAATLNVLSERWGDFPIAVDQQGRAQEFSMRYAVTFDLRRADGGVVVPAQVIELSRDYVVPPADSLGRASERELLVREIRRDMVAAMLRRLASVSRAPAPAPAATQSTQ